MHIIFAKIGALMASIGAFLMFQQAQIAPISTPVIPLTSTASVSQEVVLEGVASPIPSPKISPSSLPTPDLNKLVDQISDLQNSIANFTPEPTPTPQVVYVTVTPVPTPLPTSTAEPEVLPSVLNISTTHDDIYNLTYVKMSLKNPQGNMLDMWVHVTTDYPGFPSSFNIKSSRGFTICSSFDENHIQRDDCQTSANGVPVSEHFGTFNFHFSQLDLGLEKDFQITITP